MLQVKRTRTIYALKRLIMLSTMLKWQVYTWVDLKKLLVDDEANFDSNVEILVYSYKTHLHLYARVHSSRYLCRFWYTNRFDGNWVASQNQN